MISIRKYGASGSLKLALIMAAILDLFKINICTYSLETRCICFFSGAGGGWADRKSVCKTFPWGSDGYKILTFEKLVNLNKILSTSF